VGPQRAAITPPGQVAPSGGKKSFLAATAGLLQRLGDWLADSWARLLATRNGTDVHILVSALFALAFTALLYTLVIWPLPSSWYVWQLFANRGWTQYASTFLALWAVVILLCKARLLRQQRLALARFALPAAPEKITRDSAGAFLAQVHEQERRSGRSFVAQRVRRGLEHLAGGGDVQGVTGQMALQGEIDAETVAGSYSIVKVCLGAIPILGFIGTCVGIAQAVSQFEATMQAADSIAKLKDSLGSIMGTQTGGGLSTAFDTTLLALVLALVLLFPSSLLEKAEDGNLAAVEEYCAAQVLPRLDAIASGGELATAESVEQAIQRALVPHHAELRAWSEKLSALGDGLMAQVVSAWQTMQKQAQEAATRQLEQQKAVGEAQTRELARVNQTLLEGAARVHQDLADLHQRQVQQAREVGASLGTDLRRLEEQARQLQRVLGEDWVQVMGQFTQTLAALRQESGQVQTELRDNLRAACTALRVLVERLEGTKPLLDQINQSVALAQQVATDGARPARKGLFARLFGKK
jgi:hypothetical protein